MPNTLYADAFAAVAPHAWRHRSATIRGERHTILVFNYEKTNKAKQADLLAVFQFDSLAGYGKSRKGVGHHWVHPTRIPFALASIDAGPFAIDAKDISCAYGPVRWFLLLDCETGEVWGVDVSGGYVAERGAEAVRLAGSVAELDIVAAKS